MAVADPPLVVVPPVLIAPLAPQLPALAAARVAAAGTVRLPRRPRAAQPAFVIDIAELAVFERFS